MTEQERTALTARGSAMGFVSEAQSAVPVSTHETLGEQSKAGKESID
ncbi:MAG: hypothetical protein ACUVTG_15810 [Candidatus Oleimicrobiaceae bacterium]